MQEAPCWIDACRFGVRNWRMRNNCDDTFEFRDKRAQLFARWLHGCSSLGGSVVVRCMLPDVAQAPFRNPTVCVCGRRFCQDGKLMEFRNVVKCTYTQLEFEINSIRRENPNQLQDPGALRKLLSSAYGQCGRRPHCHSSPAPERSRQAAGSCKNLNSERLSF